MSGTVDFHMHTTFSDGIWTPSDVVRAAAEHGVGILAVTDHDNMSALEEVRAAGEKFGVKIVAGTEISTTFHDKAIHIIALNFDEKEKILNEFLEKNTALRKGYLVEKMPLLNKVRAAAGETLIDIDDYAAYCGEFFGNAKTIKYFVSKGICPDAETAGKLLHSVKLDRRFPSPEEAIKAIHAAGGVAILAHPFAPKISLKKITEDQVEQKKLVAEMVSCGLDGIECQQSSHSPEDERLAREIAAEQGLLVSGGTDWHGPLKDLNEEAVRSYIPYYSEFPGSLNIAQDYVAPLLERLGIAVDKA